MSSTSLSLCGQEGEWAFTNWVSIKDVQHFQKHKKGEKNKKKKETKIKHAQRTWTQRQRRVEQLRTSELQNVPLWASKRARESGRAKPASLRFEASPAMLGAREANSVDKQPQQRTDALQSYSRNVSRDNESLARPMTIYRVRFVYVSWRVCGSQTRQLNNQTE